MMHDQSRVTDRGPAVGLSDRAVRLESVETPALLVDLDRLERNLIEMAGLCREHGKALRPHAKSHKTPEIARRQCALGAVGITVAKLGEAEAFADAGIGDIFVCYPLIGGAKLRRLLALSRAVDVSTIVDDLGAATQMSELFDGEGLCVDVLIKLDVGMHRVGALERDLRRLAHGVAELPGVSLTGVCIHEGETYGESDPARRRTLARERVGQLVEIADRLREEGFRMDRVSCGATPSVFEVLDMDGLTEVRPGNYVFFDQIQVALGVAEEDRCALSVLSTVVSHADDDRAIIDAGAKALSIDRGAHGLGVVSGYGRVVDRPDIAISALSEEHGWLELAPRATTTIGERLQIVPNHACPVVNLFDSMVVLQDGGVAERWSVAARGLVA